MSPVTVKPAVAGTGLPVSMTWFVRATGSEDRSGSTEADKAATPAAWGAAMEVPLINPQKSPGTELRMSTPGAEISTELAPKLLKDAILPWRSTAATERMFWLSKEAG